MKHLSLVSTFDLGFAARRFKDHREQGHWALAGGSAKPESSGAAWIEQIKPHQTVVGCTEQTARRFSKAACAPVGGQTVPYANKTHRAGSRD